MRFSGAGQGVRGRRWVDQRCGKTCLILDGQANQAALGNRTLRRLLRGRDDKIADAAPLHFGSTANDGERFRGNAGFESSSAGHMEPPNV